MKRSRSTLASSAQWRSSSSRTSGREAASPAKKSSDCWKSSVLALGARGGIPGKPRGRRGHAHRGAIAGGEFGPRPVWGDFGQVVAAPDEHERTLLGGLPAQRLRERRLADPRLAADQHEDRHAPRARREPFAQMASSRSRPTRGDGCGDGSMIGAPHATHKRLGDTMIPEANTSCITTDRSRTIVSVVRAEYGPRKIARPKISFGSRPTTKTGN